MERKKCQFTVYTPLYFGTYGSLLGGASSCPYDAVQDSDYCNGHQSEETRKHEQERYEDDYGYFGRNSSTSNT
jgi:hypothetical protein